MALARLWKLDLPPGTLERLAARLGSDVPFFLTGGTATGTGRGEIVRPEPDLPPLGVLVAWPGRGLGTSLIFQAFDEGGTSRKPLTAPGTVPYNEDTFVRLHKGRKVVLHNDLFVVAVRLMPQLHEIRVGLEALDPLAANMTGSGSALYALFPDAAAADSAARDFRVRGAEAIVTAFRPRHQDPPG
jgi:4-diphosphocytidyl-2-C-methyl-D-erythritol kinase